MKLKFHLPIFWRPNREALEISKLENERLMFEYNAFSFIFVD